MSNNTMKHISFVVFVGGAIAASAALLIGAPSASAATFNFAPSRLTVVEGQEVRVVVNVVPAVGERAYTAQVGLSYPNDLFAFKTIEYGDTWIPVIRPNYDEANPALTDAVKTAGYPGGFTTPKVFAVVTLTAKKAGTGTVGFGASSFVLNARNDNILSNPTLAGNVGLVALSGPQSSGVGYALASILSLGEWSNATAFISTFVFLFLLYIIYSAIRGTGEAEEE